MAVPAFPAFLFTHLHTGLSVCLGVDIFKEKFRTAPTIQGFCQATDCQHNHHPKVPMPHPHRTAHTHHTCLQSVYFLFRTRKSDGYLTLSVVFFTKMAASGTRAAGGHRSKSPHRTNDVGIDGQERPNGGEACGGARALKPLEVLTSSEMWMFWTEWDPKGWRGRASASANLFFKSDFWAVRAGNQGF